MVKKLDIPYKVLISTQSELYIYIVTFNMPFPQTFGLLEILELVGIVGTVNKAYRQILLLFDRS